MMMQKALFFVGFLGPPRGLLEAPGVKIRKNSAGNGVRHGNALTIFMNIVRAIACLTPFPAEFITIIPVGLRPPGGPGGQKFEEKLEMESCHEKL